MKNDVFISYSHQNKEIALRVYDDLARAGYKVFLDSKRILGGDEIEPTVFDELRETRHLVALWSSHAKDSRWVPREIEHFEALRRVGLRAPGEPPGKLLIMELDDTPHAYSILVHAGLKRANPPTDSMYLDAVEFIRAAISAADSRIPVQLAFLASTEDCIRAIDPERRVPLSPSFGDVAPAFSLNTPKDAADRYGSERHQWRPFAGTQCINDLCASLLTEINQLAKKYEIEFRWEHVNDSLWSQDPEEVTAVTNRMSSGPVLIVVDPVSLYDDSVYERLNRISRVLRRNEDATVLVLTNWALGEAAETLRRLVRGRADPIFQHLFQSMEPEETRAHCAIGVHDLADMKRVLIECLRKKVRRRGYGPHSALQFDAR